MRKLTPEQEQVVAHPLGCHARVLAVAGSGKSTTLAHRIKHLVDTRQAPPNAMLVLMFNSLARKQFMNHLDKVGLPSNLQPSVHTFHSFSYQVINEAIKAGLLPSKTQFWLSDKAEYVWVCLKRVISDLERAKRFPPDSVDPEQAMQAISLWKGSLIPPNRAGSFTHPHLPLVYAGFEEFRQGQEAMTYDDFIPTAIDILENNPSFYRRFCSNIQHLIVDEYQDINLGQQTLIELLAGEQADVMVVGDDDQTIYEWRGARPNFILKDFARVFDGKPVMDYTLSRSFRFGPVIAQCAANVIACNTVRVAKSLIAFQAEKPGSIQLFKGVDNTKELAEQVLLLLNQDKVPPREIIVLARMYAQMGSLETEFLSRRIPYRVEGQEPFYKRKEINALMDYIRLADHLQIPMDEKAGQWLLNIANKPSRMLSRTLLDRLVSTAKARRLSPQSILEQAAGDPSFGLSRWQTRPILELLDFLIALQSKLHHPDASEVLAWMVDQLEYLAYFQKYYGNGETADDKACTVTFFIQFVKDFKVTPLGLLEKLAKLDTTQGKPEEELILFTTIFRTKGLEFDFVVIPQCNENLMPHLKGEPMDVYDTRNSTREAVMSSTLENERRLFYVAITRARKGVMIGTSFLPSRFIEEIRLANTQAVMTTIEALATGQTDAREMLVNALSKDEHNQVLWRNLTEGYLPDLKQYRLAIDLSYARNEVPQTVGEIREGGQWAE